MYWSKVGSKRLCGHGLSQFRFACLTHLRATCQDRYRWRAESGCSRGRPRGCYQVQARMLALVEGEQGLAIFIRWASCSSMLRVGSISDPCCSLAHESSQLAHSFSAPHMAADLRRVPGQNLRSISWEGTALNPNLTACLTREEQNSATTGRFSWSATACACYIHHGPPILLGREAVLSQHIATCYGRAYTFATVVVLSSTGASERRLLRACLGSGLRLALAVDSHIFFANIRQGSGLARRMPCRSSACWKAMRA